MKTIFITIFQGVEAKNILRTDIARVLLARSDIRLVCFTENEKKASFYKKEFSHERIVYEVVPHPSTRGLDSFFRWIKFQMLRTETTALRRRMLYEDKKNPFFYYGGFLLNWFFARPLFLRCARFFDFYLIQNNTFDRYFDMYKPSGVLMAHLFDELEIHLLRAAKKRGIRTIGFINSWDKVTARSILRLLPERLVVFNDIVKQELIRHDAVNPKDIFISGVPQYDPYFKKAYGLRKDFFKKIGIDSQKKLIVYAPMGRAFSGSDWDIIDMLDAHKKKGVFGNDVDMLVRFQPNDFIREEELKKRPWLLYDYPGIRFSAKRGVDWDMTGDDLQHLANTLRHMSLLVCYASSMSIDAAIFDKPVINIDFELKKMSLAKSPTQFYRMEHYKNAIRSGGIRFVKNENELIQWIRRYINHPDTDREGRARLVREQCFYTDGESGERLGSFILSFLNEKHV